jgi:quercetin dioxygenase-like cupin family protein
MTQRQIADELGIPSSVVNRLCKSGVGSEDNICIILERLGLKKRRINELLADRRAELSKGKARETWRGFRYAYRDENEYLAETCPFPFERAYACTHLGIPISEIVDLAISYGIKNIQDLREVNPWEFIKFVEAFRNRFGDKAKEVVLAEKCEKFPPVFLFDFAAQKDAADYLDLTKCKGKVLFGLPHLVIGDYEFCKSGEIGSHRNTGGVELLYSLEGIFELTCQGLVCQTVLKPGSMLVFDARKRHSIRLVGGEKGRLLMARYDPKRKHPQPGRPRRRRQNR